MCWIFYWAEERKNRQIEVNTFTWPTSHSAFSSNICFMKTYGIFVLLQSENKIQSSEISYEMRILVTTTAYIYLS